MWTRGWGALWLVIIAILVMGAIGGEVARLGFGLGALALLVFVLTIGPKHLQQGPVAPVSP
jgi:hypothetical protein